MHSLLADTHAFHTHYGGEHLFDGARFLALP